MWFCRFNSHLFCKIKNDDALSTVTSLVVLQTSIQGNVNGLLKLTLRKKEVSMITLSIGLIKLDLRIWALHIKVLLQEPKVKSRTFMNVHFKWVCF